MTVLATDPGRSNELVGKLKEEPLAVAGYSGKNMEGLNTAATYDRMIFTDHGKLFNLSELKALVSALYGQFENSNRSRLVINVLMYSSIDELDLTKLKSVIPYIEINYYPDSLGRFRYLTIAFNRDDRRVDNEEYALMRDKTAEKVQRVLKDSYSFEDEALKTLTNAGAKGYSPTLSLSADELIRIWRPFGWEKEAVEELLRKKDGDDVVMGMRSSTGRLIAAAFFSDQSHCVNGLMVRNGETTEWATDPEFRKQGVVQALLIHLHAYLLGKRKVANIWADLRVPDPSLALPNSIEPAIRSGMTIFESEFFRYISSNHVTIGGEPQSYNSGSSVYFGDIPKAQLRSFVRGWVDGSLFTSRLMDECFRNLRLI